MQTGRSDSILKDKLLLTLIRRRYVKALIKNQGFDDNTGCSVNACSADFNIAICTAVYKLDPRYNVLDIERSLPAQSILNRS